MILSARDDATGKIDKKNKKNVSDSINQHMHKMNQKKRYYINTIITSLTLRFHNIKGREIIIALAGFIFSLWNHLFYCALDPNLFMLKLD